MMGFGKVSMRLALPVSMDAILPLIVACSSFCDDYNESAPNY
jgi:hypothetical protein